MKVSATEGVSASKRPRWLLYVLVGVCLSAALFAWGFYIQRPLSTGLDEWAKFTVYTAGLFGYLLKWGWGYRTTRKFWILFLAFLVGHCAVFVSLSLPLFSGHGLSSNLVLGLFAVSEFVVMATLVALTMRGRF